MRRAIIFFSLTFSVLVASSLRADRFYRPLSMDSLSIVRGADPNSPTASATTCENQNLESGQVPFTRCVTEDVTCVSCNGDNATARTTDQGATGPGFSQDDYYNCGGEYQVGVCTQEANNPNIYYCNLQPWDQQTYCSGALYASSQQIGAL